MKKQASKATPPTSGAVRRKKTAKKAEPLDLRIVDLGELMTTNDEQRQILASETGQYPVRHSSTFMSQFTSSAGVYRPSDEALQNSLENSRWMLNDLSIREPLDMRELAVALIPGRCEPEDPDDEDQQELCTMLEKCIDRIPRFTEFKRNLVGGAVWAGKAGMQLAYDEQYIGDERVIIPTPKTQDDYGWRPINGDKLVFRMDLANLPPGGYANQMGIRVGTGFKAGDRISDRWTVEPAGNGMAYFLTPEERRTFVVHRHKIEDAAFEDAINAGAINGKGIRSVIYWEWVQKQEILRFMMDFLERATGGMIIWPYPAGSEDARQKTRQAIEERIGGHQNVMMVPVPVGEDPSQYIPIIVEPGIGGAAELKDILVGYFNHRIKRYILGQILTSEAEATGMGSGVAAAHLGTFMQIVKYDALNLAETLTTELVRFIQIRNWPETAGIRIKYVLDTESPEVMAKLQQLYMIHSMGGDLKKEQVYSLVGAELPGPDDDVLSASGSGGGEDPQGFDTGDTMPNVRVADPKKQVVNPENN